MNDNAGAPQFIETIPRRGYRFISAVVPARQEAELPKATAIVDASVTEVVPGTPQVKPSPLRVVAIVVLILASILAGLYAMIATRHRGKPNAQETRPIASFGWCPTLSRDGKLLAYSSSVGGGQLHIWVRQTAGGEAIPVTSGPYQDLGADFSPDDTHIAFVSDRNGGGIFITPTLAGEPKKLASVGGYPRFSPSGDQILYWAPYQAVTVPTKGGQPIALSLNQEFRVNGPPLWSPNGKKILFYGVRHSDQDKPSEWWIAPLPQGPPMLARFPSMGEDVSSGFAVRAWLRTEDDREWIVYSSSNRESWKLWRVGVSSQGLVEETPELLASGSGSLAVLGSAARDGKVAYAVSTDSTAIYQIPLNHRGQKAGPTLQLPLSEGDNHFSPSVSHDGRWMAYASSILGKPPTIRLRDLNTGEDRLLDDTDHESNASTSISPDGSTVVFERDCKQGKWPGDSQNPRPCSFVKAIAGGVPEQICEGCTPRGFSADGSMALLQKYDPVDFNKTHIIAVDLRTKQLRDFLIKTSGPIFHAYFSWDDHWVAFKTYRSWGQSQSQIMIAPVSHGSAAGEAEWIAVTDGQHSDDKPQFSPDGNTLYFTSTRDGYLCVWAQRLNPATKHPLEPPFAFEHFHNSIGRDAVSNQSSDDLTVGGDKLLINLSQGHPQLWLTQMP